MPKTIKIEIKSRWFVDKVLFSYESVDNTILRTVNEANLREANLYGANLYGANLRGANLYGANLYGADLREANLYGANLRGANLREANLREANLYGANLYGADLYGANLRGANLREANLYGANLYGADLYGANLRGANLREANLREANLYGANLYGADLRGANLREANLREANLYGANLYGADLREANLYEAKNSDYTVAQTVIVAEGSIYGWKMARVGAAKVIVKLLIPEDAKRSNATGRKCRAEFAEVIAVYPKGKKRAMAKKTVVQSDHDSTFKYSVGETIRPTTPFDEDRWEECSTGIHYFITREEAENY